MRLAGLLIAASVLAAACSDEPSNAGTAATAAEPTSTTAVAPATTSSTAPAPAETSSSTSVADGDGRSGAFTFEPRPDLVPLPAQPEGVAFPTEVWPEAELSDHLDAAGAATVDRVVGAAFADDGDYGRIEAVLVVVNGQLVVERYGRGYTADEVHPSFSVAKSITNALLGILSGEGRLDMFAPAAVEEWSAPGDPRAPITPDLLARMSSGLQWNEVFDALRVAASAPDGEAAAIQADRELAQDPNTGFNYSTGSTAINGRIIGDVVGQGDAFRAWAATELFDPIGIESVELELDASGHFVAGFGANMTARDFARFGLLYQRDGVWDGQRILPEGWVDYARTPSTTTDDYGSGFWLNGDTFSAAGFLGQRVVMVPEEDVIVVVLADELSEGRLARLTEDLVAPFTSP